ncbi:MAG: type transport system ATP-binding protein, partial [Frankiales bacterium]|nr:type transport system ATP-binding protein [Frankiales bacterium]
MRRERAVAAAAAGTLLAGIISAGGVSAAPETPAIRTEQRVVELPGGPTFGQPVRLPTTVYLPAHTPAPAVIVSPGFGQTESAVATDAKYLAQRGYVAVAWTMRGFQPFN